jgi:hypothetical protein
MTPQDKRVQTINSPGSVAGPGAVITWGTATADQVDAMGLNGSGMEGLASTVHLTGVDHNLTHFEKIPVLLSVIAITKDRTRVLMV